VIAGESRDAKHPYARLGISANALDYRYSGDLLVVYPADSMNVRLLKWIAEVEQGSIVNGDTKILKQATYTVRDFESMTQVSPEIVRDYFAEPIDEALRDMKRKGLSKVEKFEFNMEIPPERLENWERWYKTICELKP